LGREKAKLHGWTLVKLGVLVSITPDICWLFQHAALKGPRDNT
jgi:hypothetical protein